MIVECKIEDLVSEMKMIEQIQKNVSFVDMIVEMIVQMKKYVIVYIEDLSQVPEMKKMWKNEIVADMVVEMIVQMQK